GLDHRFALGLFDALFERGHDVDRGLLFFDEARDFFAFDLGFDYFLERFAVAVTHLDLIDRSDHLIDQRVGKLQFVFVYLVHFEIRHFADLSHFFRVAKLVDDQTLFLWRDGDEVFAVAQHYFAEPDLAGIFQYLAKQRIGFGSDFTIGTYKVRRVVEHRRDLGLIDEADDVDDLRRLELYLGQVIGFEDRVLVLRVLITLDDVILRYDLVAFLTTLVVADWPVVVLVKLIQVNLFGCFNRVVNANGDGD